MVGHDQLTAPLHRLLDHLRGDVQGHQEFAYLPVPPAHQESSVVKPQLILKRGLPIQECKDILYCCHALHSSRNASREAVRAFSWALTSSGTVPLLIPSKALWRRVMSCSRKARRWGLSIPRA